MNISLRFLEPFRMMGWIRPEKRNPRNPDFVRGRAFARWHRKKDSEKGRPYITGTLLRSAVLRAAETLLTLPPRGRDCCAGLFDTKLTNDMPPLRQRSTPRWTSRDEVCADAENACRFCQLLGRFDGAGRGAKKGDPFHIHFSNLNLPGRPLFDGEVSVGRRRLLNRVDPVGGKAFDYFHVWELNNDRFPVFHGEITLAPEIQKETRALLKDALAFVDRLCGAMCVIKFDGGSSEAVSGTPGPDAPVKEAKAVAQAIAAFFPGGADVEKLRRIADAIRVLQGNREAVFHLPEARTGSDRHYLWDIGSKKGGEGKSIRDLLVATAETMAGNDREWQQFCVSAGEQLYLAVKGHQGGIRDRRRVLGEADWAGRPDRDVPPSLGTVVGVADHVVFGVLTAQTPFFFGKGYEGTEQTDLQVLMDEDGAYRLPRSALRGILRRDLHEALGAGCNTALGGRPCLCEVCQIMRNLTVMDARSDPMQPPEIRHRIRLNPYTGTVAEGALFTMETGPAGTWFNFHLRYRGKDIPRALTDVLRWWTEEKAFLTGMAATGKGRFVLSDLHAVRLDLKDEDSRREYLDNWGWRENPEALESRKEPLSLAAERATVSPWRAVNLTLKIDAPFLNGDPVRAAISPEGSDVVSFRTRDPEGTEAEVFACKAESLRGVVRTALSRIRTDTDRVTREEGPLHTLSHEDCDCLLCRLFGSPYQAGRVRFEDLVFDPQPEPARLDHVAIDRFTGGAAGQKKFDDLSLPGSPEHPLTLKGQIWLRRDVSGADLDALAAALRDVRNGLYPLGRNGGTGYGRVASLELVETDDAPLLAHRLAPADSGAAVEGAHPAEAEKTPEPVPWKEGPLYYPHYFLPPAKKVQRSQSEVIGHQTFHPDRFSGRLTCSLTTLTPLIVPDTSDDDAFGMAGSAKAEKAEKGENFHKSFRFFRLNDEVLLPGSEIRGVVSSVFEALTNSCFRVFDEDARLSWRMDAMPQTITAFLPGRLREEPESPAGFVVEEMEEVRYPYYDQPGLTTPTDQKAWFQTGGSGSFYDHPTPSDGVILTLTEKNRSGARPGEAAEFAVVKPEPKYDESAKFLFLATPADNAKAVSGDLVHCSPKKGYLKVAGPNKVEKERGPTNGLPSVPKYPAKVVNARPQLRKVFVPNAQKRKNRDRLLPEYACVDSGEGVTYRHNKRCERVFLEAYGHELPVTGDARLRFQQLVKDYRENAEQQKTPPVFQTRLPESGDLEDGQLVYFRSDGKQAVEIIPVRISRTVDDRYLGKRLGRELRPCHGKWIEEGDLSALGGSSTTRLLTRHPKGLCPACRLFGTPFYRGRVSFGFGRMERSPQWLAAGETSERGGAVTLPLLERPRPTWSVAKPEKDFNPKVPGRKFYVHHHGWRNVLAGRTPVLGREIVPDPNNRTVEPLAPGNRFVFDVAFENLSAEELGLLVTALRLEKGLAHKVGMAKSMGFGSAAVAVEGVRLRDAEGRFSAATPETVAEWVAAGKAKLEGDFGAGFDQIPHWRNLRKLLRYSEERPARVCYPLLEADKGEGEWANVPDYRGLKKEYPPKKRVAWLTQPWSPWHG